MRFVLPLFAALLLVPSIAPAQNLDPVRVEKRVTKLESEIRAVQRKVFPGGDPRYFEPEIAPAAAPPPAEIGTPATSPLVDLTARVGELERQLREMTGQFETNQYKMRQIEDAQAKLRADVEFRLTALEGGGAGAAAGANAPSTAVTPPPTTRPAVKAEPAKPAFANADAAWKAAYGKALGKDWSGTQSAMSDFIAAWPKSTRIDARDAHARLDQRFGFGRAPQLLGNDETRATPLGW